MPNFVRKLCSRCKMLKSDFTGDRKRCDACSNERRDSFSLIRNDPVKWARWLDVKRVANARRKLAKDRAVAAETAKRNARFRDISGEPCLEERPLESVTHPFLADMLKRYADGESTTEIADFYKMNSGTVYNLLAKAGVKFRTRKQATSDAMKKWHAARPATIEEVFDTDQIVQRYKAGDSLARLAKEFNLERKTVKNRLLERGVQLRSGTEQWALMFGKDGER